jgi:hypothetical protein
VKAPTELVMVSAQVPVELRDDFKAIAEKGERSVSAELRRVMRRHVDEQKAKAVSA